jgi:hypothetical protein
MGARGAKFSFGALFRTIYAFCLFGATTTHALTIMRHGLIWDYGGVPWPTAVYWTTLAVADPAAIGLLFLRPRWGVIATALIIVTDVIHNTWFVMHEGEFGGPRRWILANIPFLLQVAFLVFVAATIRRAWGRSRRKKRVHAVVNGARSRSSSTRRSTSTPGQGGRVHQ